MNPDNRLGTWMLGVAGLLLAGLMGYTLFFPGGASLGGLADEATGLKAGSPRVAIFLPDRRDWYDFRRAVAACEPKGILRIVAETEDSLVVESPRTRRQIRFERHDVRGVSDTRAEVRRLGDGQPPPIAVVGSTTTVLTVALAEPLREEGDAGPVLLVPWATAVMVQRSDPGRGEARRDPVPLIELDAGRTFRFCPNNRRLAESAVECLVARDDGRLPSRVFLVVDPFDPYSDDLADCFRHAIRTRKPDVEIVERADAVDLPSYARPLDLSPEPSAAEVALADSIVAGVESAAGRTTWAVLPLQDHPARRMIAALRRRAAWRTGSTDRSDAPGTLRIVCGDAIERQALVGLAGREGLSIWCASTSSAPPADPGVTDDTQALAEIALSLVWAVDRASSLAPASTEVRDALRRIDLAADDPLAFGRRLAFEVTGERRGDPERVLAVEPGTDRPIEFARGAGGTWQPVTPAGQTPLR